jgi:hypothetical protein
MSGQKHQPRKYVKKSSKKADSRLMEERGEKRSGSESDAHRGRKRSRLHEHHQDEHTLLSARPDADFEQDLNPLDQAGENHGENLTLLAGARSADEIKRMHSILADLTNDELKSITVLPAGTHLEQGAKYLDLRHLEQGEFVATSDMVAGTDTYYVPKKETDYVLWNRLNQIDLPARLDETS